MFKNDRLKKIDFFYVPTINSFILRTLKSYGIKEKQLINSSIQKQDDSAPSNAAQLAIQQEAPGYLHVGTRMERTVPAVPCRFAIRHSQSTENIPDSSPAFQLQSKVDLHVDAHYGGSFDTKEIERRSMVE